MPEQIAWAIAVGIVITACGVTFSLITLARNVGKSSSKQQPQTKEVPLDVSRSLNHDLELVRTQQFGRSMVPQQRSVPARLQPSLTSKKQA